MNYLLGGNMTEYINTEQMQRAACTFDNAVDQMQRVSGSIENSVHCLTQLFGQGYGTNIDKLIEQLEELNSNLRVIGGIK